MEDEERGLDVWSPHQQEEDEGFPFDGFADESLLEQLMFEEHQRMQNEYSIINECIVPTLLQGIQSVWLLIVLCLILRCLSLLKINERLLHLASSLAGFAILWHFYGDSSGYVVLLSVIGYICLGNSYTGNGSFVSVLCVAFLLGCEKFIVKEMDWNKIRGSVMIVSMKLIYIGFEKQSKNMDDLGTFGYYGYILNPASIIFGPFITYRDYLQLFQPHALTFSWAGHVIKTITLSVICLLWSTCGNMFLLPKLGSNKWLDAYKDANGFRFSTYFISYVSESTCLIVGIGTMSNIAKASSSDGLKQDVSQEKNLIDKASVEDDFKQKPDTNEEKTSKAVINEQVSWSRPVSKPLAVEIPRSLVEVVTNWNLPMHYWLKNYVFKSYKFLGIFPAILLTYFASALLHGLNFQLSVILLSIGVFAYIENGLRKTLATTFDACIEARKCKTNCSHQYKKNNFWVTCTNLAFGFLAVWNLAYLGCLFDNNPEIQDTGYSMSHALRKWASLGYICHYFMLGVFFINKMIRDGVLFECPQWIKSLMKSVQ